MITTPSITELPFSKYDHQAQNDNNAEYNCNSQYDNQAQNGNNAEYNCNSKHEHHANYDYPVKYDIDQFGKYEKILTYCHANVLPTEIEISYLRAV